MNHFIQTQKPLSLILWSVFLVTAIRIFYISPWTIGSDFQLFFDEAQYWTWSKSLDFGYFSKPPVIAWLIASTTSMCGDSTSCIKLGAPLLHACTSLLIFFTAQRILKAKTAIFSALIYLTLPGTTVSSTFISADSPLLFFWALALYSFVRAIQNQQFRWWLIMGFAVGAGLMSKYTMIAFYPSIGLFLLFTPSLRRHLFRPQLWLAVTLSFFLFFPNLWWNYQNDFISFSHNKQNVLSNGIAVYPLLMLEFIGGQFGLFGPILFSALLAIPFLRKKLPPKETTASANHLPPLAFLLYTSFTLLTVAIIFSFLSGAQAHWAAPVYIAASILVSHFLITLGKQKFLTASLILHIICAFLFFHIEQIHSFTPLKKHPLARIHLWNQAAEETKNLHKTYHKTLILSDERKATAINMYQLRHEDGTPYEIFKWNPDGIPHDYYDMTTDLTPHKGKTFIILTRVSSITTFAPYFRNVQKIKEITINNKIFTAYLLQSFKGY